MAVLTLCLRDLKKGVFTLRAFRYVTLVASGRYMPAFERIFCCRVISDRKDRGLEAIHGVARSTFAAVGARAELTLVRILVAVHAFRKRNRCLKIPPRVAVAARNRYVFAQQGILCLGVIEPLQLNDPVPVRGVMARLTRRCKAALVRIGMARRALRKGQAGVFHIRFCACDGNVALRA
jgi:hypothetical protein